MGVPLSIGEGASSPVPQPSRRPHSLMPTRQNPHSLLSVTSTPGKEPHPRGTEGDGGALMGEERRDSEGQAQRERRNVRSWK